MLAMVIHFVIVPIRVVFAIEALVLCVLAADVIALVNALLVPAVVPAAVMVVAIAAGKEGHAQQAQRQQKRRNKSSKHGKLLLRFAGCHERRRPSAILLPA
jgi:hypothetical protein